eukprot:1141213-Pelagomonas_calceolata.AAC.1
MALHRTRKLRRGLAAVPANVGSLAVAKGVPEWPPTAQASRHTTCLKAFLYLYPRDLCAPITVFNVVLWPLHSCHCGPCTSVTMTLALMSL